MQHWNNFWMDKINLIETLPIHDTKSGEIGPRLQDPQCSQATYINPEAAKMSCVQVDQVALFLQVIYSLELPQVLPVLHMSAGSFGLWATKNAFERLSILATGQLQLSQFKARQ